MSPTDTSTTVTTLVVLALVWFLVGAAIYVWYAWALSRLFPRLGTDGWRGWVPVLNEMTIFERGGVPAWNVVFYFLPVVNLYALYLKFIAAGRIGEQFGRGTGTAVLAVLVPPVWATMLALQQTPDAAVAGRRMEQVLGHREVQGGLSAAESAPAPADPPAWPTPMAAEPPAPAHRAPVALPEEPPVFAQAAAPAPERAADALGASQPHVQSAPPPAPVDPASPAITSPYLASAPAPSSAPEVDPGRASAAPHPAPGRDLSAAPAPPPSAPLAPEPAGASAPHAPVSDPIVVHNPWARPTAGQSSPAGPVAPAPAATPAAPPSMSTPAAPAAPAGVPSWLSEVEQASGTAATPSAADAELDDEDDDYGETVVVDRKPRIRWRLEVDDVGPLALTEDRVVLGRRPSATVPGTQALAVPDSTRTLSKSHARLELVDGEWSITDLDSTNGVLIVDAAGEEALVEAGDTVPVPGRFILGKVGMSISYEAGDS